MRNPYQPMLAALAVLLLAGCDLVGPPRPDRSSQQRVAWLLTEAAGNRLELAVPTAGADCARFAGVDIIESDAMIDLQAWIEVIPGEGCFMGLSVHRVTVDLTMPFGLRPLTGCMIEQSGAVYRTRTSCAELIVV